MNDNDQNLLLLIGRLEGKLDALIQSSHRQSGQIVEIEARLMKLEASRAWMVGAASVISILATLASHLFIR